MAFYKDSRVDLTVQKYLKNKTIIQEDVDLIEAYLDNRSAVGSLSQRKRELI